MTSSALPILSLIGLVYALRAFLGYRSVSQDAEQDYEYKKEQKEHKMLDGRISRDGYIRVFKRLHNPRRPTYIAATVFAILILTWPIPCF